MRERERERERGKEREREKRESEEEREKWRERGKKKHKVHNKETSSKISHLLEVRDPPRWLEKREAKENKGVRKQQRNNYYWKGKTTFSIKYLTFSFPPNSTHLGFFLASTVIVSVPTLN